LGGYDLQFSQVIVGVYSAGLYYRLHIGLGAIGDRRDIVQVAVAVGRVDEVRVDDVVRIELLNQVLNQLHAFIRVFSEITVESVLGKLGRRCLAGAALGPLQITSAYQMIASLKVALNLLDVRP